MKDVFNIFRSSLRRKLLILFFTHPELELYMREIAHRLSVDPGNLSKELASLEKQRLFLSRTRGREKFYKINKEFIFYKEIKSIIYKKVGLK